MGAVGGGWGQLGAVGRSRGLVFGHFCPKFASKVLFEKHVGGGNWGQLGAVGGSWSRRRAGFQPFLSEICLGKYSLRSTQVGAVGGSWGRLGAVGGGWGRLGAVGFASNVVGAVGGGWGRLGAVGGQLGAVGRGGGLAILSEICLERSLSST